MKYALLVVSVFAIAAMAAVPRAVAQVQAVGAVQAISAGHSEQAGTVFANARGYGTVFSGPPRKFLLGVAILRGWPLLPFHVNSNEIEIGPLAPGNVESIPGGLQLNGEQKRLWVNNNALPGTYIGYALVATGIPDEFGDVNEWEILHEDASDAFVVLGEPGSGGGPGNGGVDPGGQ